jgi:ABC-type phosphate/phosphonate transport system permease subunit
MNITPLNQRNSIFNNLKEKNNYDQLQQLLIAVAEKDIPDSVIEKINLVINFLNNVEEGNSRFQKMMKKAEADILKLLDKELKMVPINHYKKLWMVLGMSAFGMPLGVAFGISVGNLGLLGLGFPIGMGIGVFFGISQDKKALAEGRQLAFEAKY